MLDVDQKVELKVFLTPKVSSSCGIFNLAYVLDLINEQTQERWFICIDNCYFIVPTNISFSSIVDRSLTVTVVSLGKIHIFRGTILDMLASVRGSPPQCLISDLPSRARVNAEVVACLSNGGCSLPYEVYGHTELNFPTAHLHMNKCVWLLSSTQCDNHRYRTN